MVNKKTKKTPVELPFFFFLSFFNHALSLHFLSVASLSSV